tara:strand:- start:525 stop:947 length:423 start_codon:yes stop_codon:yes gene_type:complete
MLLLKESSSSSSRTTKYRRRLFFRVVGVVIRVDKDGVVSLSLSQRFVQCENVYTKEQMEKNFTGVLFLGAHFFSYYYAHFYTKLRTPHHLVSNDATVRTRFGTKECTKALLVFPRKERERGGLLSPFARCARLFSVLLLP